MHKDMLCVQWSDT